MSFNDDYSYDEDFDETDIKKDKEEEKQIEKELESEASDLDVDGFAEMYKEFCGKTLPLMYKDYANKDYINESWKATTCSVVDTLDKIGWKTMSSEDRRTYFSMIAGYAGFDVDEYNRKYYQVVYSIAYQIVWAACRKLRSNKARTNIDDIVSETLLNVASDTTQLSKYDPTYSPITYLDHLIKTNVSQAYYKNTESEKKVTTMRRDIDRVKALSKGYKNPHVIDSVGYFQLFMESKRLQNPPAFSEIDAVLNDIYRKDMSYNDNISVSSDEALQELVQDDGYMSIMNSSEAVQNIIDVLKKRYRGRYKEYLEAFIFYAEGIESEPDFHKTYKHDERYIKGVEVKRVLSNDYQLKRMGKRNGFLTGTDTELHMNDNSITPDIIDGIMGGDMDTYISP